jgi:hypothetical protein
VVELPADDAERPAGTGGRPTNSGGQSIGSGEIPAGSSEVLAGSGGIPAGTAEPSTVRPIEPAAAPPAARPADPATRPAGEGAPHAWIRPAGTSALTEALPADPPELDARAAPIFHRLATELGCPDLGCAPTGAPRSIAWQGADLSAVPEPTPQAPAVVAAGQARSLEHAATRTASDRADPPDDNSDTGGTSADNLPQSGAGGAQAEAYPEAQAADDGETLPTTGPEVLAMIAMSQILMVGGAALRVAARPRRQDA